MRQAPRCRCSSALSKRHACLASVARRSTARSSEATCRCRAARSTAGMSSRGAAWRPSSTGTCRADLFRRRVENGADVIGRPTVLLRDDVGVVARHLHRGPTQTGLLLGFRDHGVQDGGLEVPERMEMDVSVHPRPSPDLGERMTHGIGMGRLGTIGLGGEDEAILSQLRTCIRRQVVSCVPQRHERLSGALVNSDRANTGAGLRILSTVGLTTSSSPGLLSDGAVVGNGKTGGDPLLLAPTLGLAEAQCPVQRHAEVGGARV